MKQPEEIEFHVGHYGDGTGAGGYVDEVQYARKFIKRIYDICVANKVPATYYEDKTSKNQTQNINHLVTHHNKDRNGLIVSGHLNATSPLTDRPIGVEVLYTTQKDLAAKVAKVMSDASGLNNRGAKYRDNIGVLTKTYEPSILIEFGFVNSKKDVELMDKHFEAICLSIAEQLAKTIGKTLKLSTESSVEEKKEVSKVTQILLNETGRAEAKGLIKKAVAAGIFEKLHLDKLDKYSDVELISYSITYVNRTAK